MATDTTVPPGPRTLHVPVKGMDCAACARHVEGAIAGMPGVESVHVFLAADQAVVRGDPTQVTLPAIRRAVAGAGYRVPVVAAEEDAERAEGETTSECSVLASRWVPLEAPWRWQPRIWHACGTTGCSYLMLFASLVARCAP